MALAKRTSARVRCINVGDGMQHGVAMARDGRCARCCGWSSAGNIMRGSKKRSAALAGIGLQAGRQGSSQARVTASKFTDGMKERLRELVRTRAPEAGVVSYPRGIVRRTSERRQQELVLVTLVEGPCEPDSFIAEENARCGGASLRIVKPASE